MNNAQGETTVSACDKVAHVKKGDTLVVRLPSQVTVGYSWRVVSQTAGILTPLGGPKAERQDRSDIDGGEEVQVFRFSASATGSETLVFHYRRPWETDKPPVRTCDLVVEVDE